MLSLLVDLREPASIFQMISDEIDDVVEEFVEPFSVFGGDFKVGGVVFEGFCLSLFFGDLSFLLEVDLVADDYFDGIGHLVFLEHIVPDFEVLEGSFFGDIVDHDCAVGVLHVVWYQTPEAFLACSVPELDAVLMPISGHIFYMKIDADGRLNHQIPTLSPS